MNDNLNDYIQGFLHCVLLGGLVSLGKSIFDELRHLLNIYKVTKNRKVITDSLDLDALLSKNHSSNKLVFIEGKAEKLFERRNNYIRPDIIYSEAHETYLEDFLLKIQGNQILIQPSLNTKFYLGKQNKTYVTKGSTFWEILKLILFSESHVIKQGDPLFIYGVANNKNNNKNDYLMKKLYRIKPIAINSTSMDDLVYQIKSETMTKILFQGLFFGIMSMMLLLSAQQFLLPKLRFLRFKTRNRYSTYCSICNENICNIICFECDGLCIYCSDCYIKLQDKINLDEVRLNEIKCVHCDKTLKCVQMLITS